MAEWKGQVLLCNLNAIFKKKNSALYLVCALIPINPFMLDSYGIWKTFFLLLIFSFLALEQSAGSCSLAPGSPHLPHRGRQPAALSGQRESGLAVCVSPRI